MLDRKLEPIVIALILEENDPVRGVVKERTIQSEELLRTELSNQSC